MDGDNKEKIIPAKRPKRAWHWRVVLAVVALGATLATGVAGFLLYARLTALPSPPSLPALFPKDALLYLELPRVGDLLTSAKRLQYMREAAWLGPDGRPRPSLPERLPIDDDESLEKEHERIAKLRQFFVLAKVLASGDIAAAMLPDSDPENEVWLIAARLDSAGAEGLIAGLDGMLRLTRRSSARTVGGASVVLFRDDDPEDAIQFVRLGDTVVVLLGTEAPEPLDELVARYDAADHSGGLATPLAEARERMTLSLANSKAEGRIALTLFAQGAAVREQGLRDARSHLARGDADDAAGALDLVELYGAADSTLLELRIGPDGLLIDGVAVPAVGHFAAIRGHTPADDAAPFPPRPDFAADTDLGSADGEPIQAAGLLFVQGRGGVDRIVTNAFRDYLDLHVDPASLDLRSPPADLDVVSARLARFSGTAWPPSPPWGTAAVALLPRLGAELSYRAATVWAEMRGREGDGNNISPSIMGVLAPAGEAQPPEPELRFTPSKGGIGLNVIYPDADTEMIADFPHRGVTNGGLGRIPDDLPAPPGFAAADLARAFPAAPQAPQWLLWIDTAGFAFVDSEASRALRLAEADDAKSYRATQRSLSLLRDTQTLTACAWFDAETGWTRFRLWATPPAASE